MDPNKNCPLLHNKQQDLFGFYHEVGGQDLIKVIYLWMQQS